MLEQVLCVVEHFLCLSIENVVSYVKRIRLVRCRQANERGTESYGKPLIFGICCITTDWGSMYYLLVEKQL